MKVRSITSFYDPRGKQSPKELNSLQDLSRKLSEKISSELMPVQSTRLATSPFAAFLPCHNEDRCLAVVAEMERDTFEKGWSYLSLGPAYPDQLPVYPLIPKILSTTKSTFLTTIISDDRYLYPAAVRETAKIISQNARLEKDGFANLRFAALANVKPYAPFLPAAYHQPGDAPAISFAMECADVVLDAFLQDIPIVQAKKFLLEKLSAVAGEITAIFNSLSKGSGVDLRGFDFSPAPYPVDSCSLGAAVEAVGIEHIGGSGSLAPAAIIAETLNQGDWQKAGFNGLMLPLLEDSRLSARSIEGHLGVQDLLLYSTLCGTGLDTIPLDGQTSINQLTSVLMDIATLATRLGKPLTARLMPIPGKKAGELTTFNFEFFSKARVLFVSGQSLDPLRFGSDPIPILPHQPNQG